MVFALFLVATAYKLQDGIWGKDGYVVLSERRAEVAASVEMLAQKQIARERLEDRTRRLRVDTLDLDLLNERVRIMLGYVRPDELLLLAPRSN